MLNRLYNFYDALGICINPEILKMYIQIEVLKNKYIRQLLNAFNRLALTFLHYKQALKCVRM